MLGFKKVTKPNIAITKAYTILATIRAGKLDQDVGLQSA
jgi:hypothetical protein